MKKLCLVCLVGLLSLSAHAQKQALFITAPALQAGDNPVSNRLASLGFTVTRIDAPASVTADANGKDLIVISSSVTSGDVATKFTASPVPLINGEPALYDELGMDANNAGGGTVTGTNITIVNCAHPMAAGFLAGPVTVITASGPLQTLGTPVASAQIVATDGAGTATLFGFEKGASLLAARIATAPARRVGIFWEATTLMTADGLKLFDAAVAWATAAPAATNAPVGITSQPANLTINASTLGTFSVGFTGAAPYSVQWQRSNGSGGFTNIPGATCAAYATAENGISVRAVVANSFNSVTSSVATLHVKQALFITAAALATGDNAVSNRLASLGFAVTRVDAIASVSGDANGKDLIVVSSSVASGDVATKFTASPVPLIDGESAIYDELGMDSSNSGGTTVASQTNIIIVDCTHPIAAGLPRGSTTVLTAPGPLVTLATPVASAQIIATLDDGTGRPSVFAIEAGAPLLPARIATAPARRVGIFWEATTFMNPNGLKIFDAAVAWATGTPGPTNAPITITSQPASVSVNETVSASFSVGFSGAGPYSIQWRRSSGAGSFTNIPGATCPTFVTGPTVPADNGVSFSAVVNNGFSAATSSVATLTVVFDRTPPTMVLAFGGGSPPTSFDLTYSEPVDPSTAGEVLSYELASGASINGATLDPDGKTVHFTSDPITNGTVLRLVSSITDRAFTPNTLKPGDPGSSIAIIATGGAVRRHVFNNIGGGTSVPDLTNNVRFPSSPDIVDFPTVFETTPGAADNYGVQLVGYVTAPVSGNYTFYMSSDDNGVLFLSTDENPGNKRMIAFEQQWANSREWTGNAGNAAGRNLAAPQNISTTLFPGGIPLVQGRRYYIEALMKEGIGGDNLGVAWQRPGDPVPAIGSSPIPGLYLTPFNQPAALAAGQPANVSIQETRTATFSVSPSGSPFLTVQWYQNGSAITGATNASYTTGVLTTNDSGKTYFAVVANSFSSVTSRVATLTVTRDVTGPLILGVASVSGADIGICFDEALASATATNPANYSVNGGAITVSNVTLRYDSQTVLLALNGRVTNGFRVAVNNVLDTSGNAISAGNSSTGNVAGLTPVNIGTPGDPSFGQSFSCRNGEFELIVGGGDIWGNEDHGHFAYQQIAGNFDKRVLVARVDPLADSSKGGLMVRESLDAGSRNLHAIVMPPPPRRNIFETGTRDTTAGATAGWGLSTVPVNGNLPATHPNSWIRMRRIGTIWKAYVSTNGVNWIQNGESVQLYPDSVFFLLESCANNGNAGPTNRVLFQNLGDTVIPGISVAINQQPVAASIDANHNVSFSVGATASGIAASEIGYQWQRSNGAGGFTNINAIGANSATFTFVAALADNNAQYRAVAALPGTNAVSGTATLTVTNDVTPPRVLSALRNCASPNQITVTFDGLVDATTAGEALNYGVNNDTIAVTAVSVASNRLSAVVTAASAIPDATFNLLRVEGVRDLANNAMPQTQVLISLAGGRSAVSNQIVFEAENFNANTPASDGHFFAFANAPAGVGAFSGAGYMQSFPETGAAINQPGHTAPGASPRLDYCINFPVAGTWRVWVRGNDIGGGNSIHIGLDGNSSANENFRIGNTGGATGWGNPAGATSPWQWSRDANDSTSTFAAVVVTNAGSHVFNIWMREDGTLVDKVLLTLDTAFTFSPNTVIGPNETPLVDTTPSTRLTITRSGTNVTITSPIPAGAGRLQQATNVSGPWSVITNANPANYTTPATGAGRFFRLIIP